MAQVSRAHYWASSSRDLRKNNLKRSSYMTEPLLVATRPKSTVPVAISAITIALALWGTLTGIPFVSAQEEGQDKSLADCQNCPEMIVIPSGNFLLGSSEVDPGHQEDESPQIAVSLPEFAISRHEVTVGQFKAFVQATGYQDETGCLSMQESGSWGYDPMKSWRNPGFEQDDDHPVTCVSWNAANDYVAWLNEAFDSEQYRLLSESEWEYAARAGSTTTYWWGENENDFCELTNGVDRSARARFPSWERAGECDDGYVFTAPVGHYESQNAFGVEDMVGNVWEWVSDCYADSYASKPRDGSPQLSDESCERRVIRGGAWGDYGAFYLRSAYRGAWDPTQSFTNLGFRIAMTKAVASD